MNDDVRARTIAEGKKACPREASYDPFCSRRCADIDLYKWLKGSYVIPGVAKPGEDSGDVED